MASNPSSGQMTKSTYVTPQRVRERGHTRCRLSTAGDISSATRRGARWAVADCSKKMIWSYSTLLHKKGSTS